MKDWFVKYVLHRYSRSIVLKTIYVCILSYVGFWLWQIDPRLYFPVVFAGWIVLFICFGYHSNRALFDVMFWLALLNIIIYASVLYTRWDTDIFQSSAGLVGILYGEALLLGLVISLTEPPRDDVICSLYGRQ